MIKISLKVIALSLFLFTIFFTHSEDWQVPTAEAFTVDACYGTPYDASGNPTFYPGGSINCIAGGSPSVALNNFSPTTITTGQSATISFTSSNATWCTWNGTGPWNGVVVNSPTNASGYLTSPITATTPTMNTAGSYTAYLKCYNDTYDGPPSVSTSETRTLTVTAPTPPAPPSPFSASCALQSNGTYNIPLSWGLVTGAINYPVRLSGPSRATNPGRNLAYTEDVVGMGVAGDSAPTGSSYTWTGLSSGGTYSTWMHAWNNNGWSTQVTRSVTCQPSVPTGLTATAGACGTGQITITWNAVSGAASYTLTDTTTGANITQAGTSYTHTGLVEGSSHTYVVRSNTTGASSANSTSVTRSAPTACTYTVTYNGNGNTSGTVPASQTKTHGVNLTLRTNTGALARTNYSFSGWNTTAAGNGNFYSPGGTYSTDASVTLYAMWDLAQPPAPTVSTGASCGGQLSASWTSVSGFSYDLQYRQTGTTGAWTLLTNVTSPRTITGLTPGTSYDIQLRAKSSPLTSSWSAYGTGVSSSACSYSCTGSIPVNASAYDAEESSSLPADGIWTYAATDSATKCQYKCDSVYNWDGSSCAPPTYTVTYNGNGNTGGTVPANQTKTYNTNLTLRTNTGLLSRTNYTYSGWNTAALGNGDEYAAGATYSANAPVTLYAKWVPGTPTGLTATAGACGTGQISLSWNSVAGVTYTLTDSSTGLSVTQAGNTYTHTGLVDGSSHTYSVRANNTAGSSAYSAGVTRLAPSACVPPPPATPTGLNATAGACGTGQIMVAWNAVAGTGITYNLRDGATVIASGISATSYSHTGLTAGSPHSYSVMATNGSDSSAYSTAVARSAPSACQGPAVSAGSDRTITLPTTSANTLGASASDPDGSISTISWSRVSGPAVATITSGNTLSPTFSNMSSVGTYVFRLTVTDNSGLSSTDDMSVIVNPAPTYSCTSLPLNASGYDAEEETGLVANTAWTYAASDTATKCEFRCNTAYWWNGGSCVLPDLSASNATPVMGASYTNAQAVTFTGSAINSAAAPITQGGWADVEIDYYQDGSVNLTQNAFGGVRLGSFTQSQSKALSATVVAGTLPVGNHRYRFSVDSDGTGVVESNESNNRPATWVNFTVTVAGTADLVSQSLTYSGTQEVGNTLTLGATVRNAGTLAAGAFSDDYTYQWGGTSGAWTSISTIGKAGLAVGDTSSDGASFALTRTGTLYIQHCVDTYNQITESSESNCSVSSGITINNSTTASCGAQTVSNCTLPATVHGGSAGSCSNGYGGSCSYTCNNGTWTTPSSNTCTGPSITTFRVCTTATGVCTNAPGTHIVATGTPLTLSWVSSADTCTAVTGVGFSTGAGSPASGSDAITASAVPNSTGTYTIACRYGTGVPAQRTLSVQTTGVGPELTVPRTVRQGSTARVEWDTNNGNETSCTLTGGGVNGATALGNGTLTNETGYVDVVIQGRTTFTLTCAGQSAVRSIEIIPVGWES